ncbi:MAG: c-type cytochrome [Magnetococcales bacterium]|nr:c-type cytochrome [Magnetococcales bacterium]
MHYPNKAIMLVVTSMLYLSGFAGGAQAGPAAKADAQPTKQAAVQQPEASAKEPAANAQHGQVLFKENCEVCHQEEGRGKPGLAPSLTNKELLSAASDRFLLETIRDGRSPTAMPSFGAYMKDNDIKDIIAYLRSFHKTALIGDRVDNDRPAMGDPRLGKRWFTQVCAGCHGVNGGGYAEAGSGSGTAIGTSGFLSKASDGFIRYIIMNGRSNTPMRGFYGPDGLASLTHQEIDDIISYLRIIQN